jgi:hypothetical protein
MPKRITFLSGDKDKRSLIKFEGKAAAEACLPGQSEIAQSKAKCSNQARSEGVVASLVQDLIGDGIGL